MPETVLITGGAGGIGQAFAKTFAEKKHPLVLVDIAKERLLAVKQELESTYSIKVETVVSDLSKDDAAKDIEQALNERNIEIDILINNAGFGDFGRFIDIDWGRERALVGVNVLTVMQLTHIFANKMVKRGKGKILNVASIAAWGAGPYMPCYYASKAFIHSFSQSVAHELKKTGVTVTCLIPGPTKTGFEKNADMKQSKMFTLFPPQSADQVASHGYKALMKGKVIHVTRFGLKMLGLLMRIGTERTKRAVATYINTGAFK